MEFLLSIITKYKFGLIVLGLWKTWSIWYGSVQEELKTILLLVDELAKDGRIDKADRKTIALKIIDLAEKRNIIKINFVTRFFINKLINKIAETLPDYDTSKYVVVVDTVVNKK